MGRAAGIMRGRNSWDPGTLFLAPGSLGHVASLCQHILPAAIPWLLCPLQATPFLGRQFIQVFPCLQG